MQVHLDPKFEAMIREKVESGEYADASDVVTDALRLMEPTIDVPSNSELTLRKGSRRSSGERASSSRRNAWT